MKYSHGLTNVTFDQDSEILKSRIQNSITIRAIEYELDLNLDPN